MSSRAPAEQIDPVCLCVAACSSGVANSITDIVILMLCKAPCLGTGQKLQVALRELNQIAAAVDCKLACQQARTRFIFWLPNSQAFLWMTFN